MQTQNYIEIINNLYLGNLSISHDNNFINSMKLIINLSMYPLKINTTTKNNIEVMNINIYDEPKEDLSIYFDTTYKKINDALDNNEKVLVYCKIGKSRSVSIIINYLMTKYNICYDLAFIEMLKKKSEIGPNYGFIEQLKTYHKNRLKNIFIYDEIEQKNNQQLLQLKEQLEQKIDGKKTQSEWQALKKDREILRYIENIL